MARTIADALDGELDVILVRKLRAPGQPELAIGAVDEAGAVLKGQYFDVGSDQYMREEIRTQQEILRKRRNLYTRTQAAIRAVRARVPARIVVAIGVAPAAALERFRAEADEVVCLYAPEDFYAVGQFFEDFSEVNDDMVVAAPAPPKTPLPSCANVRARLEQ